MIESTCIEPGCSSEQIQARGLCDRHYRRHRNQGTLDQSGRPKYESVRKLRDIDLESMTLTCPKHGPGARLRARVRATKNGRTEYSCLDCRNDDRRGKPRSKPRPSQKGQGAYLRTTYPPGMSQQEIRRIQGFRKYGLTPEQVDLMRATQGNSCAICGVTFEEYGKRGPCIDHCHTTQQVRGLLCIRCNTGLGMFRDNVGHLSAAISYLAG